MLLNRATAYLGYLALRVAICVLQSLRLETCEQIASLLATLCGDLLGMRRRIIDENLRYAFPDLSAEQRRTLAHRMWKHLFLLVAEVAHAPRKIHETNWRHYVRLKDADRVVRVLLGDRPSVLISGHFGNFEFSGFVLGMLGFPTYTVARTLDNPYVDTFVNRFRGATGQHIIPKNGGYDQILAVLAHSGAMAFLVDQYAGTKGCWVKFFNRPASAHKAIALLALEHQCPVVLGDAVRTDRILHFDLTIHAVADPLDGGPETAGVRELTQWFTTGLESIIRRHPEQYWWLHDRWKDKRPAKQRAKQAA